MKNYTLNDAAVISVGWLIILIAAATVLPPSSTFENSEAAVLIIVAFWVWLLVTVIALVRYFYWGWRKAASVSNRTAYLVWMSFESACLVAAILALVWNAITTSDSILKARENVLRQDLFVLRSTARQYVQDKQGCPHFLSQLVDAGYIRKIPIDPITGRADTWKLECSRGEGALPFVSVRSASRATAKDGTPYSKW